MIRILIFSSLMIVMAGGLAFNVPAEAQQLFIKKTENKADGEKSGKAKLFVSPKGSSSSLNKKSSVKYSDKLNLVQDISFNKEQIKSFEFWEKSGRTPQTLEEKLAYSQARHSVQYGVMLERKRQLIPALEKRMRKVSGSGTYGEALAKDSAQSFQQAALGLQKHFDEAGYDVQIPTSPDGLNSSNLAAVKLDPQGADKSSSETTHSAWVRNGSTKQKTVTVKKKSVFNSGS